MLVTFAVFNSLAWCVCSGHTVCMYRYARRLWMPKVSPVTAKMIGNATCQGMFARCLSFRMNYQLPRKRACSNCWTGLGACPTSEQNKVAPLVEVPNLTIDQRQFELQRQSQARSMILGHQLNWYPSDRKLRISPRS